MAASREPKVFEDSNYRKKMYSPLKNDGFVPEKQSELFVTGIPPQSTIHDLLEFFEQIGEVFEIKLMTKPDGVQNRGFAYVAYMNKQLAKMALDQLKDKLFENKTKLTLQLSVDNCRIFINGIPTNKSRYDVRNVLRYDYRIENIVDVITYRSYVNPAHNRGFAFVEFRTHEEASYFRAKYWDKLYMFGKKVSVTWAIPLKEMNEQEALKVKCLFVRNLDVTEPPEDFTRFIYELIDRSLVEKVYKFKDYAYIHLTTRCNAEKLLTSLQAYYKDTMVEVCFAKPPNRFGDRCSRNPSLALQGPATVEPQSSRKPSHFHQRRPSSKTRSKQERPVVAAPSHQFPPIGQFIAQPTAPNFWWYPAANEYQQRKPDIVSGQAHECRYWPTGAGPSMFSSPASLECFNLEAMVESILA